MKKQVFGKIQVLDLLAAVFCAALFAFFFVEIRYGRNLIDESFYVAVAQRFARGDRPLVDDWHISQLPQLFLVPLYQLFKWITGGVEGVILYVRQIFLLVDLAIYWLLYAKLRSYGIWGFLATAVFCGSIPWAMFAFSYYTQVAWLLLLLSLLLFFGEQLPSKGKLLLSGVLLSAVVVVEPPLALLYFLYSAVVLLFALIKKKKPAFKTDYAFLVNWRCWFYITAAVAVCAAVFLTFLGVKSGFGNIFRNLPELLTETEHNFSSDGNVWGFFWSKMPTVKRIFGMENLILSVVLCVVAPIYAKFGRQGFGRCILFLLSNALLLSICIFPIVASLKNRANIFDFWFYCGATSTPLLTFGLVNYLLCKEKNRKLLLIWIIGALSSLGIDLFSNVSFCACTILTAVPGILCFGTVLRECFAYERERKAELEKLGDKGTYKAKYLRRLRVHRAFSAVSVAAFVVFLAWCGANLYEKTTTLVMEKVELHKAGQSITQPITLEKMRRGPYKGIYTSAETAQVYHDTLDDLDLVNSLSDGPVYLDVPQTMSSIYLDLPASNGSLWNSYEPRDRQLRYFAMHPEKQPDIIYYAFRDAFNTYDYGEEQISLFREFIRQLCEGTFIEGKNGILVKVTKWKDPSDPALTAWVQEHRTVF